MQERWISTVHTEGLTTVTIELLELMHHLHDVDRFADIAPARQVLAESGDPSERAAAGFVVAVSIQESGDFERAEARLRQVIATDGADDRVINLVTLNLARMLAFLGRFDEAEELIDEVESVAADTLATALLSERAYLMSRREVFDEAAKLWQQMIEHAQAEGHRRVEMLARTGYATDLLELDQLDQSEYELRRVLLAEETGNRTRAHANHALSRLLTRRGALAEALHRIDQIDELYLTRPWAAAGLAMVRAEANLTARILDEAATSAAEALARSLERPDGPEVADAFVLRARVAIAGRSLEPAVADISEALKRYRKGARSLRSARAERLLRALDPTVVPNFPLEALTNDISLIEALFLTINRSATVQATVPYLKAIAAASEADSVAIRTLGLSAAAQLALATGGQAEARRIIGDLLDAGEQVADGIGSLEMRANVFYDLTGAEFIAIALGQRSDPANIFRLMDAVTSHVHRRTIAKANDTRFLQQLVSLRTRSVPDIAPDQAMPRVDGAQAPWLTEEADALEQRIRSLSRLGRSTAPVAPSDRHWTDAPPPDTPTVTFIVASGAVWRCATDGVETTLEHVGPLSDVERAIRRFRFTFDLAVNGLRPGLDVEDVHRSGDRLGALLLGDSRTSGRPLNIRLNRYFTNVPWRLLNPSASKHDWVNPGVPQRIDAATMPPIERVTIIAGPGLGQPALDETKALERIYPGARVLIGPEATVDRALRAFETSDLVHVIGHGQPHAVDPLLAQIDLHDGPIMAYELEALRSSPAIVVLAACDVAAAGPTGRPAAYGIPSVLLEAGTLAVLASPMWIDNQTSSLVMPELHAALARGLTPVDALALLPNGQARRDLTAQAMVSMQAGPIVG